MKKDVEYYMSLPYEIIIRKLEAKEGGGYFARYKDFPYIMGDGDSEAEAIVDVKEAFKFMIETDLKEKKYIKEPNKETRVRINISLPYDLLAQIDKITTNRSQFLTNLAQQSLNTNNTN